jgi:predicted transcriptional regulator
MTNSNLSETVDNINILNVNIREVLIEVLPVVSPELQLEITLLLRQIYHINSLIEEKKNEDRE